MTARPDPVVVAYASGHGFGHAARMSVVLEALGARWPGLRVVVKTTAPARLFPRVSNLRVVRADVDATPVQRDALHVDWDATLASMRRWVQGADQWVAREVRRLRLIRPVLVVADIAPLALEAASRAGVPSALVANFTWEWILAHGPHASRAGDLIRFFSTCTAKATWCFLTWPACEEVSHPTPVPVGLVGKTCRVDRTEVRRLMHLDQAQHVALVTFGGSVPPQVNMSALEAQGLAVWDARPTRWPDCASDPPIPHACLVQASDVVVGKLGYSTLAEALIHGTPFLWVRRPDWPEEQILEKALSLIPHRALTWGEVQGMEWGGLALDLARTPRPCGQIPYGASQIATLLSCALGPVETGEPVTRESSTS